MDAEKVEENPFESPITPSVDRRYWWALWTATGLLALLAVVSAFFDPLTPLTLLIPLVGIPGLVRTLFDLGRKQSAGWMIDAGVQLKSFAASIAIATLALLAGGIAGFTVCIGGAMGADSMSANEGVINAITFACGLLTIGAIGGLFYLMGPRKVDQLEKRRADHRGGGE